MLLVSRSRFAFKALQELGLEQVALYAKYQLGLRTGYFKYATGKAIQKSSSPSVTPNLYPSFTLPDPQAISNLLGTEGTNALLDEANEILAGQVRLFGGPCVPLQLRPPMPAAHWTNYETGKIKPLSDEIKWIWEPGRFGWAYTLGRAYHLSTIEDYAESFWQHFEEFQSANPPNMGPHWVSAQEVALRLIAFVFAAQCFTRSPRSTEIRKAELTKAIAAHAARIPPTLAYARAQNNNHLLCEAAGLYTAGISLPDHPQADYWLKLGERWFNHGIQTQINPAGTYVQHSANYHRLMLQIALWVDLLAKSNLELETSSSVSNPRPLSQGFTRQRLAAATRWLMTLLDPQAGQVPNLGPNDSAYIFPLTICPIEDFRPVLQSAALAFLDESILAPGPWDEMALWFGYERSKGGEGNHTRSRPPSSTIASFPAHDPHVIGSNRSWAYLRVTEFNSRPGHADQLHLDLWWRGINVAQDPGTYLYNDAPPWDNSLTRTAVHNTITVDGLNQMTPAGRFLWLDWAQATIEHTGRHPDGSYDHISAQHDGYRKLNLIHRRTVEHQNSEWVIKDEVFPISARKSIPHNSQSGRHVHEISLHWLLPDWLWEIEEKTNDSLLVLRILSPHGWIKLTIQIQSNFSAPDSSKEPKIQIIREGQSIRGTGGVNPTLGWMSTIYGYKQPALSLCVSIEAGPPLALISKWNFPE